MSHNFTRYVISLSPAGEPDVESFHRLWQSLRGVLRSEVKRRGLWESSPSYLGVYGWRRWHSPPPGLDLARASRAVMSGDALDELVADCYVYIFIRRLRSLRTHLRRKPNIDGLVFRAMRNFLHDTQKRRDPLGFRVFTILKSALRQAVRREELRVIDGGPKISTGAIFGFRATAEPSRAAAADLEEIVRRWNDELLPELVTATGKARQAVVERLQGRVAELPAAGIEAFGFKDLIDPLKADVRARWAALFHSVEGETAFEDLDTEWVQVVRLIQPDTGVEERDSFDKLVACVAARLARHRAQRRTRGHLSSLWSFLHTFAAEAEVLAVDASGPGAGAALGERLPSRRQLSKALGIPRDRFTDLYATLRLLIEPCLAATCGEAASDTRQRGLLFGEGRRAS